MTKTCHACTRPVSVSAANVPPIVAIPTWVARRMRRLGYRSAMRPPARPNNSVGTNWRAVVMPTSVALPVRLSTNQSCAIRCIQVPVLDTT